VLAQIEQAFGICSPAVVGTRVEDKRAIQPVRRCLDRFPITEDDDVRNVLGENGLRCFQRSVVIQAGRWSAYRPSRDPALNR